MNLIRYNRPLFPRRFSDVFYTFFEDNSNLEHFEPKVSIAENNKNFSVIAELPGVKKEDINVNLEENSLTISGEKKLREEKKEDNYHLIESTFGSFSRTFYLPNNVEKDKIEATFENGVLELIIPKMEIKQAANKIEIK